VITTQDDIDIVIVVKKDMHFYNCDNSFTSDSIITFEVDKNIHYVPAHEPIDILEDNDFTYFENAKELKSAAKKYKLNHLLYSM